MWLLLQKQMLRKKLFNIPFKHEALWLSRISRSKQVFRAEDTRLNTYSRGSRNDI